MKIIQWIKAKRAAAIAVLGLRVSTKVTTFVLIGLSLISIETDPTKAIYWLLFATFLDMSSHGRDA